jgi:flagellin-like protein
MTDRKGISQLIATVLLIAMVVVIAAIIFLWVRGFISEQIEKFGKPAEQVCDDIKFDATLNEIDDTLYIFNSGNVPIGDFQVKTYIGGNSDILELGSSVGEGGSQTFSLSEQLKSNTHGAERVVIIPELKGYVKGTTQIKPFSCDEKFLGKVVKPA